MNTASILANTVMAIGVVHGIILLIAIFRIRRLNPVGYAHLLVGVAAVTGVIVEEWIVYNDAWPAFPHVIRSTTWAPLVFGPSVWLFARSLRHPSFKQTDLLHYAPALLAFAYFTPFYLMSGAEKISFVQNTHVIPLESSLFGLAKAVSLFAYFSVLRMHLGAILRTDNNRLTRRFRIVVTAFLIFMAMLAAAFAAEHLIGNIPFPSDAMGAVVAGFFIYVLSLIAIADWRSFALSLPPQGADATESPVVPSREALLDDKTAKSLYDDLDRSVRESKIYREPGLKLEQLGAHTGLPPHYLSYVINSQSGKNVQNWLNRFRIQDAKKMLIEQKDRPVLQIGLAAGFNSKAAFNRAFKMETGKSPSEFRSDASQIIN